MGLNYNVWVKKIIVVGKGPGAEKLFENAKKALEELGLSAEIQRVEAHSKVLVAPALVVEDKVLIEGEAGPFGKVKRLLERACEGS